MVKGGVTCLFCENTFATSYFLRHVRVHTLEKPYFCNVCDRGFAQKGHQKTHQLTHSGYKPFKCDIGHCNKRFTQQGHLTEHKRVHFDIRKYECKFCDHSFKWNRCLTRHLRSKHLFDNWYKCPLCPEKFATIPELHPHLSTHKREDCLECPTCSSSLPNASHILIHVYMHSMEKSEECVSSPSAGGSVRNLEIYAQNVRKVRRLGRSECPFCGKIFSTFADQQEHLRTEHRNQFKMFQCQFCTKNFQRPSHLESHIHSHIHERHFVCRHPHCGKSFMQSSYRQRHMIRCRQS